MMNEPRKKCAQGFFKIRILSYVITQPASFCFILSLFLIAIELIALGIYVAKKDHMPDLDAMKNWNAYVGKLGEKDFCFQSHPSNENVSLCPLLQRNISTIFPSACNRTGKTGKNSSQYGTVGIRVNFTVGKGLLNKVIYSEFTGQDVGAKIKETPGGRRIDGKIFLHIWIQVQDNENISEVCEGEETPCTVSGCLLISAPFNAIPTRMPQIHKDFTFFTKVFSSSAARGQASCKFDNTSLHDNALGNKVDLLPDGKCTQSSLSIYRSHKWIKKYGFMNIELKEHDRKKASEHMFVAAAAVSMLGVAFGIGIVLTDRPLSPKTSQE